MENIVTKGELLIMNKFIFLQNVFKSILLHVFTLSCIEMLSQPSVEDDFSKHYVKSKNCSKQAISSFATMF